MVSPKLEIQIRGALFQAAIDAKTVGDFHRRVVEILKPRRTNVTITQKNKKGDVVNQLIVFGGGRTTVLQYHKGNRSMVHMFQERLSQMDVDPTGTHPADKRRKTVYDLLSSAMRVATGEEVNGISIDI